MLKNENYLILMFLLSFLVGLLYSEETSMGSFQFRLWAAKYRYYL